MGNSIPYPCYRQGCPGFTYKSGLCLTHYREREAKHNQANAYYHSAEWRRLSKAQLASEPDCNLCGEPATVADHIDRRRAGGIDDLSNLQSLCSVCHNRKRAKEGRPNKSVLFS